MKISKKVGNAFIVLCFIGIGIVIISNYSRKQIENSRQNISNDIDLTRENFEEYSRIVQLTKGYNTLLSNILTLGYVDDLNKLEDLINDYTYYLERMKEIGMSLENKGNLENLILKIDEKIQKIIIQKREELELKREYSNISEKIDLTELKNRQNQLFIEKNENIRSGYVFYSDFFVNYSLSKRKGNEKNEDFINKLSIFDIQKIWENDLNFILRKFSSYNEIRVYNEQIYKNNIDFRKYKENVIVELEYMEEDLPYFYSFTEINEKDKELLEFTLDAFKLKLKTISEIDEKLLEVKNEIDTKINMIENVQNRIKNSREKSLAILNNLLEGEVKKLEQIINGISVNQKTQVSLKLKKINNGLINNVKVLKKVNLGILGLVLFNLAILLAIFYYVMYKSVVKPLSHLEQEMKDIRHDNFDKKLEVVNSDDEIGDLTKAINEMLRKLSTLYEQLATQKEELEIRVQRRTMELTELNQSLNQSLEKLQETQNELVESEKMASLGGLVAGVAHEVNTPLGVSVSASSYLKDETNKLNKMYNDEAMGQDDFENYLDIATNSAGILLKNLNKASDLIKNFKKVAVDQTSEVKREFAVKDYLEDLASSMHHELKQKNHKVEIIGDDEIRINSYPGVFSQIFSNLIMNSIIHGFEGKKDGKIKIELNEKENQKLELIYSDDGRGISIENLDKIFEPFFTTKRGEGGSGLGMHILYNLVSHKLKGNVEVESKKGEGVRFIITVPVNN